MTRVLHVISYRQHGFPHLHCRHGRVHLWTAESAGHVGGQADEHGAKRTNLKSALLMSWM